MPYECVGASFQKRFGWASRYYVRVDTLSRSELALYVFKKGDSDREWSMSELPTQSLEQRADSKSEAEQSSLATGEPRKRGRKPIYSPEERKKRRKERDRLRRGLPPALAQDDRRLKPGPKGPRLSEEEKQRRAKHARRQAWLKLASDPAKTEANRAYMRRYWRKRKGLPPDAVVKIGAPRKLTPGQRSEVLHRYEILRSWKKVAEELGVCRDTLRKFLASSAVTSANAGPSGSSSEHASSQV